MLMLQPKLALLDETDLLDIDALRIVAKGVNSMRAENKAIVVVTHYRACSTTSRPTRCTCWPTARSLGPATRPRARLEEHGYAFARGAAARA